VKISVNRWELKFPKDWDISQSLGNQNSQRLGIFKITASWQFNFGKYPKNNREKRRPRPAYLGQSNDNPPLSVTFLLNFCHTNPLI
jgi:hypothetical protein